jgi:hypothetical protein
MCSHLFSQQIRNVTTSEEDKRLIAYPNHNNRRLLFYSPAPTRVLVET